MYMSIHTVSQQNRTKVIQYVTTIMHIGKKKTVNCVKLVKLVVSEVQTPLGDQYNDISTCSSLIYEWLSMIRE